VLVQSEVAMEERGGVGGGVISRRVCAHGVCDPADQMLARALPDSLLPPQIYTSDDNVL